MEENKEEVQGQEVQPKDKVERAEEAVKRMEELYSKMKEEGDRLDNLRADKIMAGETTVNQEPSREETPQEYKERVLRNDPSLGIRNE